MPKYREDDVNAALYALDKLVSLNPDAPEIIKNFATREFRETMRQGGTDEERDRFVNGAIEILTSLVSHYDQAAEGLDFDQLLKEKMGFKRGLVDLTKQLQDNPALLRETADAYCLFAATLKRCQEKKSEITADHAASPAKNIFGELIDRLGVEGAKSRVEVGISLVKTAEALLGKETGFNIVHYDKGVSTAREFSEEHDRIVIALDKDAARTAARLRAKLQELLGDSVILDGGIDRTGKKFVSIRTSRGALQPHQAQALADRAQSYAQAQAQPSERGESPHEDSNEDRNALLARIARATMGNRQFQLSHYETGQSSSRTFYESHDRIVLTDIASIPGQQALQMDFLMRRMQSVLGDDVLLNYGISRGQHFISIQGSHGALNINQLKSLAVKAENSAGRGQNRINTGDSDNLPPL